MQVANKLSKGAANASKKLKKWGKDAKKQGSKLSKDMHSKVLLLLP